MMARPNMVLVPVIFALLGGGVSAALANHNPGYYFDMRARVVHTDATAVSYTAVNPHGRLVYTMADENGDVKEWVAELPANNMMRRNGVVGREINPGDRLTLMGNPGRDGVTMLRSTRHREARLPKTCRLPMPRNIRQTLLYKHD